MKKIKYTKTDLSGNTTAFIWDKIPRQKQPDIASQMMKILVVEQVGFVEKPTRLQMMGGEISLNAAMSFAYVLSKKQNKQKLDIELSGYKGKIPCNTTGDKTTITLKPKFKITKINQTPLVNLSGIAYFLVDKKRVPNNPDYIQEFNKFKNQIKNISLPQAWGIVFYDKNIIQPVVYVAKTNSTVCENACGSGSLAMYLVYKYPEVIQPTGEAIKFKKVCNKILITGKPKIISEGMISLKGDL